jgi:TolA-binding protein
VKKLNKIIFPVILLAAIISGCAVLSPIGNGIATGYQSFIGYFNTYYNATTAFSLGEESVFNYYNTKKILYPSLDQLRQVSMYEVPPDAKVNFDKVIDKCSKILNYYTRSVLVDDALFLIGKSYFYNLEYTRAERKFLELISQFPESNLVPEAKIWCAKAFLKNRREDDAKLFLKDVIEYGKKEDENELIARSNIILSDYYLSKTDTDDAVKYYHEAIKFSDDKETLAQINFRLGEIFEKYDSLLIASDYYFKSSEISSTPSIRYWGMNKYGSIQLKFGKNDLALKIFRDLEGNPQLREYLPFTLYEIASIRLKNNDVDAAVDLFNKLDTTYSKTEPSAKGYFQMGLINELKYHDYKKAREYFQKSKDQISNIEISPQTDDRIRKLDNFLGVEKQHFISDSLYILANIPDTAIVFNFDVNITSKTKDSTALFTMMEKDTGLSKFIKPDSANRLSRDTLLLGIIKKDSALVKDTLLLLTKNHIDTIKSTEGDKTKRQFYTQKYGNTLDKVDTIIVKELSRILSIDSTRLKKATKDLGRKKYEFANAWLNQVDRPDTAIALYEELLYKYPRDEDFYPELIYYLSSSYYKNNIEKEAADSLLHILIDKYPTSQFIFESKMLLGIKIIEKQDTAKILYNQADSLFEAKMIDESLKLHEQIVKTFPTSEWASKSLYAIGWIHENHRKDYKTAIKHYRKLLTDYPNSTFAGLVKAKIDTVEKYEPSKPKLAVKKDSITKVADSLKIKEAISPGTVSPFGGKGKITPADSIKIKTLKEPEIKKQKIDSSTLRRRREIE